ncbi:MAG: hypothetical protein ABS948_14485 [Solibacillus sp.]
MAMKVRFITSEDGQDVKRIYEAGIETKMAPFESEALEFCEEWFGQVNPHCSVSPFYLQRNAPKISGGLLKKSSKFIEELVGTEIRSN